MHPAEVVTAEKVIGGGFISESIADVVQPFLSVMVTTKTPGDKPEIVLVVLAGVVYQVNLYGAVPPIGLATILPSALPWHVIFVTPIVAFN